jgi:hypothetical protein
MATITSARPGKRLAVDNYELGITQLATAVLVEVELLSDELESELVELLEPPSDFAGSLAVEAPPRLSVR